ncbi:MAG: formylmethanofuran dehydrogenase [Methylophilaceae bacterium]
MSNLSQISPATCPACGLLCDDIVPGHNTCEKSIAFFAQPIDETSPHINGKSASLNDAIKEVARILSEANQPLFDGLSTDIQGFRAIYQLAEKTNGTFAHMNNVSMQRNLKVLQSTGWQTTTLCEVKNRADLIVCIGSNIVSHNPRFFERFVEVSGMFVGKDLTSREVIFLGVEPPKTIHSPSLSSSQILPCSAKSLPEVLAALHSLVLGKSLQTTVVAGIPITDLQALADKLKAARYAVLTWIAKDLDFPHAELAIQQITQIVATLNHTSRAAGLPLGGSDGDISVNNMHTWLTGLTLDHAEVSHDALIWVNSYSAEKPTPQTHLPTVVLGNARLTFKQVPKVFIPIATPGLDCTGTLFRVDSSVVLPLKKMRETGLPTLSEVVRQIEAKLLKADA